MTSDQLRTKAITINFTQEEYDELQKRKENSTCPNMALYLRKRLYSRKIVTTFRNRSQDDILEEISRSRRCLESARAQLAHALKESPERAYLLEITDRIDLEMRKQTSLVKKLLSLWLP
ncbi:hypothetical protein [Sphingobacterium sp. NPDC055431]